MILIHRLVTLIVVIFILSCKKGIDSNTDINMPPPDGSLTGSAKFDSVIYTYYPVEQYDQFKRSWYTFRTDSSAGIFTVFRRDSIRQYNTVVTIRNTETAYSFRPGTNTLIKIHSRSGYTGVSLQSDTYDNYDFIFDYLGDQVSPYNMTAIQYRDSSSGSGISYTYGMEREYDEGDIWQYTHISQNGTNYVEYYVIGKPGFGDILSGVSIDDKDTLFVHSNSDTHYFTEWLPANQNSYKTFKNNDNIFILNGNRRSMKTFIARNYDTKIIPQGQFGGIVERVPNLERKIDFTENPELASLIETLGGKAYVANLKWLSLYYPGFGEGSYQMQNDIQGNGIDFINRLQWMSLSTTDSLLDVNNGNRNTIWVNKLTSSLTRDTKGRIISISRLADRFNTLEKMDFVYKK